VFGFQHAAVALAADELLREQHVSRLPAQPRRPLPRWRR
jgi:hypothetical protein